MGVIVKIHPHTWILGRPSFCERRSDKEGTRRSSTAARAITTAGEFKEVCVVMPEELTSHYMRVLLHELLVPCDVSWDKAIIERDVGQDPNTRTTLLCRSKFSRKPVPH